MRESRGLMGLPAPALGFDGVLAIQGVGRVEVKDGELRIGKMHLYIDEQGVAYDDNDRPVARVQNGQLVPMGAR